MVKEKINRNSVTLVIPTYRRPGPLIACVQSIVEGNLQPREIIVIGRENDNQTRESLTQVQDICAGKTVLRVGWVTQAGHVPPIQKGLALASGDLVLFVDDDVTVTADWLEYLCSPLSDPRVGVVGGRVFTPGSQPARLKGRPGCNSWYGKHWGNVSWLQGDSPIEVQSVTECNWAWRRDLLTSLKFDPVLNFDDAVMYGLDLCLQASGKGVRVIYEPRAVVYHHPAPRAPELDRADRPRRIYSYTRNYTYVMLKHLPWWRRPIFLVWWFLVGERGSWGLAAALADTFIGRFPRPDQMSSALRGRLEGIRLSSLGAHAVAPEHRFNEY